MPSELEQLKWAVQALAQSPDDQLSLFPSFVCVADELALDFSQCFEVVLSAGLLTPKQSEFLARLDTALEASSGPDHLEIWTNTALQDHEVWVHFRQLAVDALAACDWPNEAPPSGRAIYVGPKDT
jgi:hypothetical protein